jgi:hypothetical protein
MVAAVISDSVPGCYGVCCAQHARCKRYSAAEGIDTLHVIATCDDGSGARPLFIPMAQPEEIEP